MILFLKFIGFSIFHLKTNRLNSVRKCRVKKRHISRLAFKFMRQKVKGLLTTKRVAVILTNELESNLLSLLQECSVVLLAL